MRAFGKRGAGRQHVVDQHDAGTLRERPVAGAERKGAAHVALALQPTERALDRRALCPHQQVGHARDAAFPGKRLRKQRRLIEAPPDEARPMQGHGHQKVGAGQRVRAGARQPLAEMRGGVRAVGMLEAENKIAARIVIAQRRTDSRKRRALRKARRTNCVCARPAQIGAERNAAARAERPVDPCKFRPACGADAAGRGDDAFTSQTGGWNDRIETGAGTAHDQFGYPAGKFHG